MILSNKLKKKIDLYYIMPRKSSNYKKQTRKKRLVKKKSFKKRGGAIVSVACFFVETKSIFPPLEIHLCISCNAEFVISKV